MLDSPTEPLVHTSFYQFADLSDPDAVVAIVRELVEPLTGSVLVASEGISGALAASADRIAAFEHALRTDPRLDGHFQHITFKHSACATSPFWKVRVHKKDEIVALGVPGVTGVAPNPDRSRHLSPQAWRDLLAQDDVVVIDNRNSFEYRLGRFQNAIDPKVDNFRDFPSYVQAHADQWKAEGKKVAMYCTGGIRCEKTGVWMREELGLEVFQLDGGILNYLEQTARTGQPDDTWRGECFVFDNRIALDAQLHETATTAEQVYDPAQPDEAWRLARARRLDTATGA